MNFFYEIDLSDVPDLAVFIQRLKQVYAGMDNAYNCAATRYGFTCDGCQENCCRTRFYHHTLIEYAYLKEGLTSLNTKVQEQIKLRAMRVIDATEKVDGRSPADRRMCPLNFDTRCILYPYRPMICRLHGIPHELQKPGQKSLKGPGCNTFESRCGHQGYFNFDRTLFYRNMAKLESELRQAAELGGKIKMTVSEMILSYA